MNADFLLPDESSRRLFHDYAAQMPIIDYHCHLPPADIANNACFVTWPTPGWVVTTTNGAPCAPTACPKQDITGHAA
jgi:glucuronate isomerase